MVLEDEFFMKVSRRVANRELDPKRQPSAGNLVGQDQSLNGNVR
jgi:hypothetical protein